MPSQAAPAVQDESAAGNSEISSIRGRGHAEDVNESDQEDTEPQKDDEEEGGATIKFMKKYCMNRWIVSFVPRYGYI